MHSVIHARHSLLVSILFNKSFALFVWSYFSLLGVPLQFILVPSDLLYMLSVLYSICRTGTQCVEKNPSTKGYQQ